MPHSYRTDNDLDHISLIPEKLKKSEHTVTSDTIPTRLSQSFMTHCAHRWRHIGIFWFVHAGI